MNLNDIVTLSIAIHLVIEIVGTILDELRSLQVSSLDTLDTFPVEVWLQHDAGEFLVHKQIDSAQTIRKFGDLVIQSLELTSQSILDGFDIYGLRNLNCFDLVLQFCNLIIDACQILSLQIVGSSHFPLEVLQSSNLSLKRLGSSVLGNQGNEFLI